VPSFVASGAFLKRDKLLFADAATAVQVVVAAVAVAVVVVVAA